MFTCINNRMKKNSLYKMSLCNVFLYFDNTKPKQLHNHISIFYFYPTAYITLNDLQISKIHYNPKIVYFFLVNFSKTE